MNYSYYKIFRSSYSNTINLQFVPYDPAEHFHYYDFIQEQRKRGLWQLIVSSKMMIAVLEKYVAEYGYIITNIQLVEDDGDFVTECNRIKELVNAHQKDISDLTNKLYYLQDEECIDIFKIGLKKYDVVTKKAVLLEIQSNGIVKNCSDCLGETNRKLMQCIMGYIDDNMEKNI